MSEDVQISDPELQQEMDYYFKALVFQAQRRVDEALRQIEREKEELKRLEEQLKKSQEAFIVHKAVLAQLKEYIEN